MVFADKAAYLDIDSFYLDCSRFVSSTNEVFHKLTIVYSGTLAPWSGRTTHSTLRQTQGVCVEWQRSRPTWNSTCLSSTTT